MSKKLTTAEFIQKAQAVHGLSKYDYSQTVYTTAHGRITTICPEHGAFEQKAYTHSQGAGCPKCALLMLGSTTRLTTADFISKALIKHEGRYDYSLASYERTGTKIKISCLIHGVFEQTPNMHLRGEGCPGCATHKRNRAISKAQTEWTTEKLRARCQEIHPNLDFSKLEYAGPRAAVRVICPLHGEYSVHCFHNLLAGRATCKICRSLPGGSLTGPRKSKQAWLGEFDCAHQGSYDYSIVENEFLADEKISIICPVHGVFKQKARIHVEGHGCRACRNNLPWVGLAKEKGGTLYVLRLFNDNESFYKVGVTVLSYQKRYSGLGAIGYQYEPVATYFSKNAKSIYDWEQSILSSFSELKYRPNISFAGQFECFKQAEPILAILPPGTRFY